jgi:hypothetical protein
MLDEVKEKETSLSRRNRSSFLPPPQTGAPIFDRFLTMPVCADVRFVCSGIQTRLQIGAADQSLGGDLEPKPPRGEKSL